MMMCGRAVVVPRGVTGGRSCHLSGNQCLNGMGSSHNTALWRPHGHEAAPQHAHLWGHEGDTLFTLRKHRAHQNTLR